MRGGRNYGGTWAMVMEGNGYSGGKYGFGTFCLWNPTNNSTVNQIA